MIAQVRIEDFYFQLLSRIPADVGGAEIGHIHFLLATINTNLLKKKVEQNRMTLSIFMSKNVFGVCLECFSLDGSLGLQVSNFFFLFGNLLAISCSFIPHTQNNK
jgi:hypothetical protein